MTPSFISLSLPELMSAIIRDPLVISPDASVMDAVVQMNNAQSCCPDSAQTDRPLEDIDQEARSSCVVVVDADQVVGILTERDIVRLIAQQQSLHDIRVRQVMLHPAVTLRESALTSVSSVLNLLQQHCIRHLPILDEQDRLAGIVIRDSLQSAIRATPRQANAPYQTLENEDGAQTMQVVAESNGAKSWAREVNAATTTDDRQAVEVIIRQQRSAIEAAIDGIAILRGDTYLYLNQAHINLFGYERPEDMVGKTWRMLYSPEEVERFERDVLPVLERDRAWQGEAIATRKDGTTFAQGVSLTLADDGLLICVCRDISDSKRAEAALQVSEERLRLLINSLPFGVWVRDSEDRLTLQNHEDIARYGNLMGTRFDETDISQERIDRYREIKQRCWYGEPIQYETTEIIQNEEHHYLRLAAPLPDINGGLGVFGVAIDITDRKRAEKALQESEARWQFALEGAGDGVWDWNVETSSVFYSLQWKTMLGYADDEVGDRHEDWSDRVHPDDIDQCYADLHRHFYGETPVYQNEHRMRCKDGSYQWVLARGKVIEWTADRQPRRVIGIQTDISDRKQAETALQNLIEGTAATTGRDFFPALVSHIATALNVTHAVVTEYVDDTLHTLAFWANGTLQTNFSYPPAKTPCELTLRDGLFYCDVEVQQQFPEDLDLVSMGADSYLGIALHNTQGDAIGDLCILNQHPIQNPQRAEQILSVFAARASTELERQRAQTQLEQLNQELEAIVEERTAALRASEAQVRAMFDAIPDLLLRVTRDGTCLDYIEPRNNLGTFLSIRHHISEVLPPALLQQQLDHIDRAIATGMLQVYEHQFKKGDRRVYEEVRIDAISADEVLIIVRDISDRKHAETQVRSLLNRTQLLNRISSTIRDSLDLDIILQNSVNAIFAGLSIDSCTFAWYQNDRDPNVWEIVKEQKKPSLPSWLGTYYFDAFPNLFEHIVQNQLYRVDDRNALTDEPLKAFFEKMGIAAYLCLPIHTMGHKMGSLQIGRVSSELTWLDEEVELLQDISNQVAIAIYQAQLYEESQVKTQELQRSYQELQDTQLQLIQSEKMSSLGQLVAGIAHEINNPVSFIYGNLAPALRYAQSLEHLISIYQETYPNPPEAIADCMETVDIDYILSDFPKLLTSMEHGAVRIQNIVKSLRTFSRLDQAACKTVNLHENIDSTLIILQNRLNGRAGNPKIQVVKHYGDLPLVECYGGLLNQVFMNLLVNAIDAIEERQVDVSPGYSGCITITTGIVSDDKIRITVQDNGIGMGRETQAKIFNPFFTTKPTGVGTGMGLSISYQIVTGNHQGQLSCASVLGEGTTFNVELWQSIPSKE